MKLFVSRLSDECEFSREKSVVWTKIVQSCFNLLVDFYNNLLIFKILACNHCTPPAIPQTLAGATSRLPARCTSCTLPPPCLVVGVTWWPYGRLHQLPLWSAAWGGYCVVFLLLFTYSCQPRFRSGGCGVYSQWRGRVNATSAGFTLHHTVPSQCPHSSDFKLLALSRDLFLFWGGGKEGSWERKITDEHFICLNRIFCFLCFCFEDSVYHTSPCFSQMFS